MWAHGRRSRHEPVFEGAGTGVECSRGHRSLDAVQDHADDPSGSGAILVVPQSSEHGPTREIERASSSAQLDAFTVTDERRGALPRLSAPVDTEFDSPHRLGRCAAPRTRDAGRSDAAFDSGRRRDAGRHLPGHDATDRTVITQRLLRHAEQTYLCRIGVGDDALDEEIGLAGSGKKSGTGSDVTLGAGDSGINLKPSDSGLNLDEEPLDLGGSAVDSLELPEDDDVIALEEEPADPEEATQLKADDQFMLSASDALMEDESDSGSQVIALEDSEAFDENAATMLKAGEPAMLADDAFAAANMAGPADPLAAASLSPGMAPAGAGMPMYVQQAELPYSIWNVLSLFGIAMLLAVTGMFMTDVMLNMWSWNGSGSASTSLMDAVISTFGLKG